MSTKSTAVDIAKILAPVALFASGCILEYKAGVSRREEKRTCNHTVIETTETTFHPVGGGFGGVAFFGGFAAAVLLAITLHA